jgi:hypothetical protein
VDLLEHEMLVAAALGHHGAPVDTLLRALDARALEGLDPHRRGPELGDVTVLEEHHVAGV